MSPFKKYNQYCRQVTLKGAGNASHVIIEGFSVLAVLQRELYFNLLKECHFGRQFGSLVEPKMVVQFSMILTLGLPRYRFRCLLKQHPLDLKQSPPDLTPNPEAPVTNLEDSVPRLAKSQLLDGFLYMSASLQASFRLFLCNNGGIPGWVSKSCLGL